MTDNKKNIVVTGAAQGLGKEIAVQLSGNPGYKLILIDLDENELKETAESVGAEFYHCDVSNPDQIDALINVLLENFKHIDVLINNAGVMLTGPIDSYAYDLIKKTIEVNTLGTMYFSRAVVPSMKSHKSGVILNVISTAGLTGKAERSIYNASKWAITGFTESLNAELSGFGISVLGIYPSLINTNLFKNAGIEKDMSNSLDPSEVSKVVEFMLSFDRMQMTKVVLKDINHI
jgi:short-subunit dehydrogenase